MRKEIQKQRAIELLKDGKSVEYLAKRYPELGDYALRGLKAHLTMGTYDPESKDGKKMPVEKNTLLQLIQFGIPEEMILAKCKGIKASNIHAYKAHVTRGTYK